MTRVPHIQATRGRHLLRSHPIGHGLTRRLGLGVAISLVLAWWAPDAAAQTRVMIGGSYHTYIPSDDQADVLITRAPRLSISYVFASGYEVGYLYAPLRVGELDMFIDHSVLYGYVWRATPHAIAPYVRGSAGLACVNHRDYFDSGGERDTCSGPIVLRVSGGARFPRSGILGLAADLTVGVAVPEKPAAMVSVNVSADLWFL